MKLHRTSGKPDWAQVALDRRNHFQKLAAATHGVLTPANVITIIGLATVVIGLAAILQTQYGTGVGFLIVGRLLDVVDGVVADLTATKAPLGEALDASVDKVGTFLTVVVLYAAHVADWRIITGLLLPQLVTLGIILYLRRIGKTVHPTRAGKLGMALLWVGIIGLVAVEAWAVPLLIIATGIAIALSIMFGLFSGWQYATGRD